MNKEYAFPKLNPIQDGVLVCTKKQGNIEQFKYVPLSQIKFKDGTPLGTFLEGLISNNDKLEKRIKHLEEIVGLSVDYQLAQAAEGAAHEKDSIN